MSTRARPLFARVLVKREVVAKVGSIHIPEDSQKRNARLLVEVLAVGPTADPSIQPGQKVLIGRYAGDWINLDGTVITPHKDAELFIVQDEDVLCVIEEESGNV